MLITEKLKNIVNSKNYIESILGTYYNKLLNAKRLTRVNFYYNVYTKKLTCNTLFNKNKSIKTLVIKLK